MNCHWYLPGQTVVVMGAKDDAQMFLLRNGALAVERDGMKIATLPVGTLFGELTLLGVVESRTVTVRALSACAILELSQARFMDLLSKHPKDQQVFEEYHETNRSIVATMQRVPIFKAAPIKMLLLLYLQSTRLKLEANDRTLQGAAQKESAIVVLQGKAVVLDSSGMEIRWIQTGDCFNEEALLNTPNYEGKYVLPKTDCEVLVIT